MSNNHQQQSILLHFYDPNPNSSLTNNSNDSQPQMAGGRPCATYEPCPKSRYIFITSGSVIALLGVLMNGICLKIFTKSRNRNSPYLYLAVLSFLDVWICLTYVLLFGVDVTAQYLHVRFLYDLWYGYVLPLFLVSKIVQLMVPCVILTTTFERYILTTKMENEGGAAAAAEGGGKSSKCLRTLVGNRGRRTVIASVFLICVTCKLPTAAEFKVNRYPTCPDFLGSKEVWPTVFFANWLWKNWEFYVIQLLQFFLSFILLSVLNALIIQNIIQRRRAERRQKGQSIIQSNPLLKNGRPRRKSTVAHDVGRKSLAFIQRKLSRRETVQHGSPVGWRSSWNENGNEPPSFVTETSPPAVTFNGLDAFVRETSPDIDAMSVGNGYSIFDDKESGNGGGTTLGYPSPLKHAAYRRLTNDERMEIVVDPNDNLKETESPMSLLTPAVYVRHSKGSSSDEIIMDGVADAGGRNMEPTGFNEARQSLHKNESFMRKYDMPVRSEKSTHSRGGRLQSQQQEKVSSFLMADFSFDAIRLTANEMKRRESFAREISDAAKTTIALVSSHLICNSLQVFVKILEINDSRLIRNPLTGSSTQFYTYISDVISVLVMFASSVRLPIYLFCNHDIRRQFCRLFS